MPWTQLLGGGQPDAEFWSASSIRAESREWPDPSRVSARTWHDASMPNGGREMDLLDLHRRTVFRFNSGRTDDARERPQQIEGQEVRIDRECDRESLDCRDDVEDVAAVKLERLAAHEPPFSEMEAVPQSLDGYLAALGVTRSIDATLFGYLWTFPKVLRPGAYADLVLSGSPGAQPLLKRLPNTMSASLGEKGFLGPDCMWAPWCVAVVKVRLPRCPDRPIRVGRR